MRVAFDCSILGRAQFLPLARSGIYRYADRLLQALATSGQCQLSLTSFGYSLDAAGLADYLDANESLGHLPTLLNPSIRFIGNSLRQVLRASGRSSGAQASRSGLLRRAHQLGDGSLAALQQTCPPILARRMDGSQVFHTPFLHIPQAVRTVPGLRCCVTVHDLNPIVYPEYFPPVVRRWSSKVMRSITPDDRVFAVSRYVKDDLCARYPVNPENVRVTPLAADAAHFQPCHDPERLAAVRQRYGIPDGPYILSLGSLSPHKNIAHLVKCFAHLIDQEGIRDLNLVLAGTEGWMLDALEQNLANLGNPASRIIQTGFVDDEDQPALYAGATAFVFPSLCEGFGLPPLEAMQCGTPVICANTTSLPEVVGSAGILVDPVDEDALCQALLDVYRDERLRQRLGACGLEQARSFSWARCAQDTLAGYRDAMAFS